MTHGLMQYIRQHRFPHDAIFLPQEAVTYVMASKLL